MSLSSLALRTTNFASSQASWELRTGSTFRAKVLELSIIQATATAESLGLGRPGAQGITPVNVAFQPDDTTDASAMNASLSWGTSPTAPTAYHRRWNSAATVGVGIVYTFPRGLVVPASASLVVFNITTAVACDINCVLDE